MSETTKPAEAAHISQVRQMMVDQLRALRTAAGGPALADELNRAKGVSDLSQTIINSAKVEIEYLRATGQDRAGFMEEPPQVTTGNTPAAQLTFSAHEKQVRPGDGNGITSIVQHKLKG